MFEKALRNSRMNLKESTLQPVISPSASRPTIMPDGDNAEHEVRLF